MKFSFCILLLLHSSGAIGQLMFRTVAPKKPIIENESFQVQYILQDAKKPGLVTPPPFKGFRIVSGPNIYYGTVSTMHGEQPLHNVVYTLEAIKPGIYIIPGAAVLINGKLVRSNDAQIEVITREEALRDLSRQENSYPTEYFLKRGDDPYKKISENLFVKVSVNKKECLVGEPVLATFKLYSRLESRSDIVKNPGLYGFTVFDMVNLSDKEVYAEKIKGKVFDVHTIRKVQLYPLQPGVFTVDAMEIKNRVEFSVSAVTKKTEQEVVEGMLSDENEMHSPGTEVFESSTTTEPINIRVKPLPEKNKPAVFNGAVGDFRISASTNKTSFYLNEQGYLSLTISGNGNFTQLDAPIINWPKGIDGFEATVKDDVSKMDIPLSGKRTFIYPFVGVAAGHTRISPVGFSFLDPSTNNYHLVQTDSIDILIDTSKLPAPKENKIHKRSATQVPLFFLTGAAVLLLILVLILRNNKKKKIQGRISGEDLVAEQEEGNKLNIDPKDPHFYKVLYDELWNAAAIKFKLSGSAMSKQVLGEAMQEKKIRETTANEFLDLISLAELGMYATTSLEGDKPGLLIRAERLIFEIRQV